MLVALLNDIVLPDGVIGRVGHSYRNSGAKMRYTPTVRCKNGILTAAASLCDGDGEVYHVAVMRHKKGVIDGN